MMANFDAPIPVTEIESVLAWVDSFKLSRPTKKINRDFSDAVLLAEILSVHYPKLVEMHNYPPRNSHALKLNNWMTLNRKVLKKLKLNLCTNTMEQLSNSAPGIIERVLYMVREKIKRDDELLKVTKDAEQNMSSGGSYYEALADDDSVLIVPVRTRVNGVVETIQQKVINFELYNAVKEELKDTKESLEVLKQKVDHLDNLLKLRDERIDELQKQLERKSSRKKEIEAFQNSLKAPLDNMPSVPISENNSEIVVAPVSSAAPVIATNPAGPVLSKPSVRLDPEIKCDESVTRYQLDEPKVFTSKMSLSRTSIAKSEASIKTASRPASKTKQAFEEDNVDVVKSDIFKEAVETKALADTNEDEFKDSVEDLVTTIEDTIQNEINEISNNMPIIDDVK